MRPAEAAVSKIAFGRLYNQTARPLQAYLWRMCRDRALADDILQETYLRFLTARLPELDERGMKNYIFRIASNRLVDHYRRQRHERPGQETVDMAPAPSPAADPLVRIDMERLMAGLSFQERQLLWLCHAEGFTHEEVAAVAGVGAKSVRVLLFRARSKLAALIRGSGWTAGGTP